MHYGPAVRRRKLGAELRTLRARAGLTSGAAAVSVGWHQSKVSRIETGRSGVKPADVRLLLDAYGVRDSQLRALLEALANADGDGAGRHQWWHAYKSLLPPAYRDFISLEAQACQMRTLETSVIPGLLQTPDYARAVTRASLDGQPRQPGQAGQPRNPSQPSQTADLVDSLVEVRVARQDVLRGDPPLELSAVLDEAVLRRPVGGYGVMARQLRHLMTAARVPHVRLQVLPFAAGAHIGLTGPFVIFSFPDIADLDVVVLDHLMSSLYLERKEDLRAYTEAFNSLQHHALSPEDTLEFIAGIGDGT